MANIEQLCDDLGSGDQPKVFRAKRELVLLAAAAGAPGKDAERAALAAELANAEAASRPRDEKDKTPVPVYSGRVRGEVARALSEVGGDMEVPALKSQLTDFDAREMARWALDRITCQAATDALVEAALNAVGTEFRVGAINALGRRGASNVVDALKKCAADSDREVRLAAVEALANHVDASADAAMVAAGRLGGYRSALRVTKARVRLAENLARAGQKDAAKTIFQQVAAGEALEPQKKAARAALARLG